VNGRATGRRIALCPDAHHPPTGLASFVNPACASRAIPREQIRTPDRPDNGKVDGVKIIELVRGRDGKRYPAGLPRPPGEIVRIRWLEHRLAHRDGRSVSQVQTILLSQYGIRRSRGAIHNDLAGFSCPDCSDRGGSARMDPR
jgi:hypothetical protein